MNRRVTVSHEWDDETECWVLHVRVPGEVLHRENYVPQLGEYNPNCGISLDSGAAWSEDDTIDLPFESVPMMLMRFAHLAALDIWQEIAIANSRPPASDSYTSEEPSSPHAG